MKKNYKLVLGLVAGLTISAVVAQPTTTEAKIKFETPKQMGQKFYKAETEAYKGKKKVTRVFYYKTKDYKNIYKFTDMLYKEAAKAQYGDQFISRRMTEGSTDYLYRKDSYKTVKKGVGSYKITINGKSKLFREEYREAGYNRKLLADLTPLTKGKSQFDKAFITMSWFCGRAGYQCGRNQDDSNQALWNRKYHADCDNLASDYSYYAEAAGVKKVGMVSVPDEDGGHSWNYIVVDGRMYFIDFQGWTGPAIGRSWSISGQELVEKMNDPDFLMQNWTDLEWINGWYRKNVDADAKDEITCKAVFDKMPEEQKTYLYNKYTSSYDKYIFSCDSWSQSYFLPVKVYFSGRYTDYTVKQIKNKSWWDGLDGKPGKMPKNLLKYLW